jgi:hypothetical protein
VAAAISLRAAENPEDSTAAATSSRGMGVEAAGELPLATIAFLTSSRNWFVLSSRTTIVTDI